MIFRELIGDNSAVIQGTYGTYIIEIQGRNVV